MFAVATTKPWNVKSATEQSRPRPDFVLIRSEEDLSAEWLRARRISQIFFMHWSSIVPEAVWSEFECINFHPTDLPFGRGGSPYQNMIVRDMRTTMMTAHRMTGDLDAGPVYLKRPLSLSGRMKNIFCNAADVMSKMILDIPQTNPVPAKQAGPV